MMKLNMKMWLMCCLLFMGGSTQAFSPDEDFNPSNPAEPSAANICRLTVSVDPEEAAYCSGGGKYTVNGNSVYISSSARNTADYTYTFLYWTINGEKTSYSQNFYYTPQTGKYNLVAHYEKKEVVFNPDNPSEPSATNVKRKFYLYLNSSLEGACSFNIASGNKHEEKSNVYLYVSVNPGYQFEGWKLNGNIVSTSQSFNFIMPSAHTTLEACVKEIEFNPDNPIEPSGSGSNVDNTGRKLIDLWIGKDGVNVDMTRVVFNELMTLDYDLGTDSGKMPSDLAAFQIYSTDSKGNQYSINERPLDDGNVPLVIIVKESGSVTIVATRLDRTAFLYDKVLDKYQDLSVKGYTFTSAAGTFDNRFILTTNGPTFILGDANSDGQVTIDDAISIVNDVLGKTPEGYNVEAADVNDDGKVTISDATGVLNMVLNGGAASARALQQDEMEENLESR